GGRPQSVHQLGRPREMDYWNVAPPVPEARTFAALLGLPSSRSARRAVKCCKSGTPPRARWEVRLSRRIPFSPGGRRGKGEDGPASRGPRRGNPPGGGRSSTKSARAPTH